LALPEKIDRLFPALHPPLQITAYRYLDWEFDDDSKVFDDLDVSGPYAGIVIRF